MFAHIIDPTIAQAIVASTAPLWFEIASLWGARA